MPSIEEINEKQEIFGFTQIQNLILSGDVWSFEGSYGRLAMNYLEIGICYLSDKITFDYYGNKIPSRNDLEDGTKGTLLNAQNYWSSNTHFNCG